MFHVKHGKDRKMKITSMDNREVYYIFNSEEIEEISVCEVKDYYNDYIDSDYEFYKIEPNTPLLLLKIKDIDTQISFFGNWQISY